LIVVCAFLSALAFTSKHLGQLCEDGSYCGISGLRDRLPKFGNEDTNHRNKSGTHNEAQPDAALDDECALFPNTSSVLLIMKTGASESYSKIPTQLMTTLKCLPDFLIFSDMEQKIAGYRIHDSLDTVLDDIKEKNKDFDLYHRQKKCPIDQEHCNKHHDVAKQGWDLDKYKNTHMAEKAYKMRPNYDWYMFVDADTYVIFSTLMEWLKHLNPNKAHYIGSVAALGGFPFAHGGSGYLVSAATMRAMFSGKTGVANQYDEPVQHTCCGDYMWSKALLDLTGTPVVNAVSALSLTSWRFILFYFEKLIGRTVACHQRREAAHASICRRRMVPAYCHHAPRRSRGNLRLVCLRQGAEIREDDANQGPVPQVYETTTDGVSSRLGQSKRRGTVPGQDG
jgi:hypothetical protein